MEWKTIAIIFIIISLLEFTIFVWAINVGTDIIEKENECSINTCGTYDTYYFDDVSSICYCYEDKELILYRYL